MAGLFLVLMIPVAMVAVPCRPPLQHATARGLPHTERDSYRDTVVLQRGGSVPARTAALIARFAQRS